MSLMRPQFWFVFVTFLFAFSCASASALAENKLPRPVRAGLSIGAAPVGGAALSVDTGPLLYPNVTLGVEVYGIRSFGFRFLVWENSRFMTGLNGGGKLLLALGSRVAFEPGLEMGWNHRFSNKLDAGAGVNLVIGEAIGASLKLSVGYLLQ